MAGARPYHWLEMRGMTGRGAQTGWPSNPLHNPGQGPGQASGSSPGRDLETGVNLHSGKGLLHRGWMGRDQLP